MGRTTRHWCDMCLKDIPRVEVQWSACPDNRWRTFDFCGYPCAETFRANMLKHKDHGRSSDGDGPDDPDCPCRGGTEQTQCAFSGCGFCRAAQS